MRRLHLLRLHLLRLELLRSLWRQWDLKRWR